MCFLWKSQIWAYSTTEDITIKIFEFIEIRQKQRSEDLNLTIDSITY